MTTATALTSAQRRALVVLATGHRERRYVRVSNETRDKPEHQGMLCIHHAPAAWFAQYGYIEQPTPCSGLTQLTRAGRALAREAGL